MGNQPFGKRGLNTAQSASISKPAYTAPARTASVSDIDEGLRAYMLRVYNLMAMGVAITAIVILAMMTSEELMEIAFLASLPCCAAILGIGFMAPRLMFSGNAALAHLCYWTYVALWGVGLTPQVAVSLAIDPNMVFRAFLVTSLNFGVMSLIGYTTKRDLCGWGGFLSMAALGLIIAAVVNVFFVGSLGLSFLISCGVVLLFTAVTAFETQAIKEMYDSDEAEGMTSRKAIFGAFLLYGTFATLFSHILNIMRIFSGED